MFVYLFLVFSSSLILLLTMSAFLTASDSFKADSRRSISPSRNCFLSMFLSMSVFLSTAERNSFSRVFTALTVLLYGLSWVLECPMFRCAFETAARALEADSSSAPVFMILTILSKRWFLSFCETDVPPWPMKTELSKHSRSIPRRFSPTLSPVLG